MLDAGYWMLDFWILDARYWVLGKNNL